MIPIASITFFSKTYKSPRLCIVNVWGPWIPLIDMTSPSPPPLHSCFPPISFSQEHAAIFILVHLSSTSFPLSVSLLYCLIKTKAAQSKQFCSLGLCKWTSIFIAVDSELRGNAVISHFNLFHYLSCPVSLCRWVQIACPRLSVDWGTAFSKPLLSPYEVHTSCIQHLSLLKQREEISLHLLPGSHSTQRLGTYLCFE